MTIFEMKAQLAELGQQLRSISDEIRSKAGDPGVKIEDLRALKATQANTEERFNMLKGEIDAVEKEQRAKLERQAKQDNPMHGVENQEQRMIAAKADLIRSVVLRREMAEETRATLQALPAAGGTGGENFLPVTMMNRLIHEPFVTNPLRGKIGMTNIKGLELPKISFTIDDDFVTDADTATELSLTGDKASFGRHKFKVFAAISDTVLHGSDIGLVNYVENALRSGLAAKEKKVAFAAGETVPEAETHMSFYEVGITEVEGETKLKAIKAAIAALPEGYRERAQVCMTFADFTEILEGLANGNATLYDAPPERIIGKPVFFSDSATTPIVGDWNYAHLNYDGDLIYDSDKDVKKGEYLFVLTAWIDQQILLKSAFRLAKVAEAPPVG